MPRSIIEVLRQTLAQLEQSDDCQPGDPALMRLRLGVEETIAKLQAAEHLSPQPELAPRPSESSTKPN